MTRCLSSTDSDKVAGGREAGITQGGSSHAVRKTGRLDTLPLEAQVVAKKNQSNLLALMLVIHDHSYI